MRGSRAEVTAPLPPIPPDVFDRTSTLSAIAQESAARLNNAEPEWRAFRDGMRAGKSLRGKAERDYQTLNRSVTADALITIVFAALALEACLYTMTLQIRRDAVATLLNQTRFPTLNRWRVLLWLLTGEFLAEDAQLYLDLKRLIGARNNIVHSKALVVSPETRKRVRAWDVVNEAKHAVDTLRAFERYVHGFHINLAYTLLKI